MLEILQRGFEPPIMIFVKQKKSCDRIALDLKNSGVRLHVAIY